jgi:hypothetical protein
MPVTLAPLAPSILNNPLEELLKAINEGDIDDIERILMTIQDGHPPFSFITQTSEESDHTPQTLFTTMIEALSGNDSSITPSGCFKTCDTETKERLIEISKKLRLFKQLERKIEAIPTGDKFLPKI